MNTTFTILGCGSSGGVPRIGGDWGACDPANPKNRRRRCSIMIEQSGPGGVTRVVVDTSPDLREQMLSENVGDIDGVWFTHEHADHTHGVDDLRAFFLRQRKRVPIWADDATTAMLKDRFAYIFKSQPGSDYPPIVEHHRIAAGREISTDGAGGAISAVPFDVPHGRQTALGFRIGKVAYTPDVHDIPAAARDLLTDLDVWIVDALRPALHPSHFSLSQALQWIDVLKPKHAVLTNMHVDLDYDTLRKSLPPHVEPAYDGMKILA